MKKGKLVVIDGTDGSGKTTQINLLSENLKKLASRSGKKINFEIISFPQYGKNKYAKSIVDYLEGKMGAINEVDPYDAARLYAKDRKTVREKILGWLNAGKLIISNRYVSSSKAHLAATISEEKRDQFIKWIDDLEYKKNKMPKEDTTILLIVDPKTGQKNALKKQTPDIHEEDLKHLSLANKIYLELAEKENWTVINCMGNGKMKSKENIQKDLLEKINVLLSPS